MGLRFYWADLKAASKSDSIVKNVKWFLFNHTSHLSLLFRLGQDLYRVPYLGKGLAFIVEYVIRVVYSSDISCRARIGPGFVISHGHDIVIGADVTIGENCTIFNGVTLGNKNLAVASTGAQPKVWDNVIISTGAKILGNISIGNNVIIGANAVVIKGFPSNVTLVGVPARIVGGDRTTNAA